MAKKVTKIIRKPRKTRNRIKGRGESKRKTKKSLPLVLAKLPENPIISPKPENSWEAWQTFNPGAILLKDKIHFLYRAIGEDGLSRFGYASSNDGFTIDERLPYPVYEHDLKKQNIPAFSFYSYASGGSFGGAEDPRLVRVKNEDKIYITYTACDEGLRVALTSIKVADFLQKEWKWKPPKLISPPGEAHKNWVLFPEKIKDKYALLTSVNPKIQISYFDNLEFENNSYVRSVYNGMCQKNCWDTYVHGTGPPPIKTKHGWLLFYHAMDERDWGKYKVGAMLLDLADPTKILRRSPYPILEPEEVYENNGFKAGVVYASSAVVKNGTLLVYYGAADSFIGVAYVLLKEFLAALITETKPKLKRKIIKQKL